MPPLVVKSLIKDYREKKGAKALRAINDISFEVEKGECFGLLGPNGAGKSTTINCITGLFPPTQGEVLIEGHNVFLEPKLARAHLGVCPQDSSLETEFSVFDQLVLHASYFRIPRVVAEERASHLLKKLHLQDKIYNLSDSLSGGMVRRLQVARALMSDPKVLVLDEPTTGLDPEARRVLWDILVEYRKKGVAIILTTHYMDEAERLCDRIAIMFNGKILDMDTPQNLIKRHMNETIIEEELRPGVIWKRPPNLEDVFLKLAGSPLGDTFAYK